MSSARAGNLALFMPNSPVIFLIAFLVVAVVPIEFALSERARKRTDNSQAARAEEGSETEATA
jgi:hypothetical protein